MQRGKGLFARYRRESGLQMMREEDTDPCDFVVWLYSLRPSLAKTSGWRIYRAAALAWVQTLPHDGRDEAISMLEADIGIGADQGRAKPSDRQSDKTLSEPAQRFGYRDFVKVQKMAGIVSRSQAVPWLREWLLAGIHTGLQPSEWAAAVLEVRADPKMPRRRRAWLHVLNAKAPGTDAVQRTLDISNFSDDAFEVVRRHTERVNAWSLAGQFEMRHSQCAQLLYDTCAALFPRQQQHYSLHSLRHQFIANIKTIYGPAEVAALVGHIGKVEKAKHYAKRPAAWRSNEIRDVPVPMPGLVKRMARQWRLFHEREKMKKLRQDLLERRRQARAKKARREG